MFSQAILLGLLVLVATPIDAISSSLETINDRLIKKVDNVNLDENLREVNEWLARIKSNCLQFRFKLVKDLTLVARLADLRGDKMCDLEGYQIMRDLDNKMLGIVFDLAFDWKPKTRIERLIALAAQEHGQYCEDKFKQAFELKSLIVGNETMAIGRKIAEAMKVSKLLKPAERVCRDRLDQFDIEDGKFLDAAILIRSVVIEAAKDDENVKYMSLVKDENRGELTLYMKKLEDMVKKYAFEPCNHLTSTMNDVMLPTEQVHQAMRKDPRHPKAGYTELYDAVDDFCYCRLLIAIGSKKLVGKMKQYVMQKSPRGNIVVNYRS